MVLVKKRVRTYYIGLWCLFISVYLIGHVAAEKKAGFITETASDQLEDDDNKVIVYDPNVCEIPDTERLSNSKSCTYITEHCDTSNFIFAKVYYCSRSSDHLSKKSFRFLSLISIAILIVFLFITLGLIASNFVTPNLVYLSRFLNMDEKIAGLTLLSFGNSSPDLFSTYAAMRSDSVSLAIGELIGSATFACSMVLGMMIIISPFKVNKINFIRDVLFFALLICISLIFLHDGQLTLFECVSMLLMYSVYMITMIKQSYNVEIENIVEVHSPIPQQPPQPMQHQRSPTSFRIPSPNSIEEEEEENTLLSNNAGTHLYSPVEVITPMDKVFVNHLETYEKHVGNRLSLFDAMKLSLRTYDLSTKRNHLNTEAALNHEQSRQDSHSDPHHLHSENPMESRFAASNSGMYNSEPGARDMFIPPAKKNIDTNEVVFKPPKIITTFEDGHVDSADYDGGDREYMGTNIQDVNLPDSTTSLQIPSYTRQSSFESTRSVNSQSSNRSTVSTSSVLLQSIHSVETFNVKFSLGRYLFPAFYSIDFRLHPFETVLNLLSTPLVAILSATIPVPVESIEKENTPEDEDREIDNSVLDTMMALFNVQVFCFPYILFNHDSLLDYQFNKNNNDFIIILACLLALSLNVLMRRNFETMYNKNFKFLSSVVGFTSCLIWISSCASYIVKLLKNIGVIYHIKESLLGLTLLSLGNSVGDLIANCTLARCGFQLTALSACLGSPLLYILVGIGLSGIIVILTGGSTFKTIEFQVDSSFYVSSFGLICLLIFYCVYLPLNDWNASRVVGVVAVLTWVGITGINVVLEVYM